MLIDSQLSTESTQLRAQLASAQTDLAAARQAERKLLDAASGFVDKSRGLEVQVDLFKAEREKLAEQVHTHTHIYSYFERRSSMLLGTKLRTCTLHP